VRRYSAGLPALRPRGEIGKEASYGLLALTSSVGRNKGLRASPLLSGRENATYWSSSSSESVPKLRVAGSGAMGAVLSHHLEPVCG